MKPTTRGVEYVFFPLYPPLIRYPPYQLRPLPDVPTAHTTAAILIVPATLSKLAAPTTLIVAAMPQRPTLTIPSVPTKAPVCRSNRTHRTYRAYRICHADRTYHAHRTDLWNLTYLARARNADSSSARLTHHANNPLTPTTTTCCLCVRVSFCERESVWCMAVVCECAGERVHDDIACVAVWVRDLMWVGCRCQGCACSHPTIEQLTYPEHCHTGDIQGHAPSLSLMEARVSSATFGGTILEINFT